MLTVSLELVKHLVVSYRWNLFTIILSMKITVISLVKTNKTSLSLKYKK